MISENRSRRPAVGHVPAAPAGAPAARSVTAKLEPHGVVIRTGPRQKLALACAAGESLYLVRSGVFVAYGTLGTLAGPRHKLFAVVYPGDVFRASLMPSVSAIGVTSVARSGVVWRFRWPAIQALADTDPDIAHFLHARLAEQSARLALHAAIIGSLSGEERVASLIVELALRIGVPAAGGLAIDMPLSRADMADYLALNADTVSRIVSRLRAKGLVTQGGRNRLICRDLRALAEETPIAHMLEAMHGAELRTQGMGSRDPA